MLLPFFKVLNQTSMQRYIDEGFLKRDGDFLAATDRGLLLLDTIVPDLLYT